MWEKVKCWLIKKLGGYTKAEYDDFSRFPGIKYEFLPPQTRDVVKLCAHGEFSCFDSPPPEWIENRLMDELARQMKPYVTLAWSEDYCKMTKCVRAVVKVVS